MPTTKQHTDKTKSRTGLCYKNWFIVFVFIVVYGIVNAANNNTRVANARDGGEYSPHFCSIHFSESNLQMTKHITLQFFNDSLGINSLRGFIALNKVNSILEKFIDLKVNKEYCTLNNIEKQEIILTDIKKLNEFSKQNNISQYSLEILNHINEINLPFFDKYPDIQSINEKVVNQVPEKDYPEWIHGQSTLKILIIMKLCDNPKYESYKASKEKEYIFFVNQNPSMWKPAYDTFLSLVKYLG